MPSTPNEDAINNVTVEKMPFAKRVLLCAAGAILASLLTACGSGSGTTTPANIRLVNTTDTGVSLALNGGYILSDIASDGASGYEQVPPGTYSVSVSSANSSLSPSSQTVGLGTGENYTTLAYARGNSVYSATITDDLATPAVGQATLDVANISPDAGPLDVYLLAPGVTSLTPSDSPNFASVSTLSTAATFTAGAFNIIVTAAGNQSDVRISLIGTGGAGAVTFTSQQVATLALTDTAGGTLVNAFVVTQAGAVAAFPNTQARVRVMSALPVASNLAVVASIGGTALATEYAPNPTQYALVTAGASAVISSISVGGTPITTTLPTTALAAGQDYTILVYGTGTTAGTGTATLLSDDNLIIPNYASVRVVNGALSASGGVSLYVDGTETATGVLYGTASGYTGVTPTSSASLQLVGSGYVESLTGQNLVTGSVYTVFLYDATQPPLLIKDR